MRLHALATLIPTMLLAGSTPHAPRQAGCAAPAFHALDYWIGDWDVYGGGKRYASQHIHAALGGCAIVAEWSGPEGDRGFSLFAFDPKRSVWRQTYATNQVPAAAGVTWREADFDATRPGLSFQSPHDTAAPARRDRLTIAPLPGDRVRMMLELSNDGGRSWRVVFDAEHRRSDGAHR